jgi:hypothetical protein
MTDINQLNDLKAYIESVLFSDDPAAAEAALEQGASVLEGVEADEYRGALEQVLAEHDVAPETQGQILDQVDASDDYSVDGIRQQLNLIYNDQDLTNTVDQSLDSHGEIHGDVVQENDSNVANATGEGSIAGQYVEGNQSQTGDGQQVGGDSGVQNQGNNSGQQAGYDATADNVTTGNNNTVGSDNANRVGAGQVSQDGAYIDNSAQAFGEGAATNTSTDSYDSHDSFSESATATDSFNEFDNDTNTQTQSIEDNSGHGATEYEPIFEDGYKSDEHDDYKVDEHHHGDDYDQDASIVEVD